MTHTQVISKVTFIFTRVAVAGMVICE